MASSSAVNLGKDSDTVGAVTGQLAGAMYGLAAIPKRWLEPLAWREALGREAVVLAQLSMRCS
jgi:ADP-ribosyl-[dinitrogen reductase] hydrolase